MTLLIITNIITAVVAGTLGMLAMALLVAASRTMEQRRNA